MTDENKTQVYCEDEQASTPCSEEEEDLIIVNNKILLTLVILRHNHITKLSEYISSFFLMDCENQARCHTKRNCSPNPSVQIFSVYYMICLLYTSRCV